MKRIFKSILLVTLFTIFMIPSVVFAGDESALNEEQTYKVTLTALHGTTPITNTTVMITNSSETVTYGTTDSSGIAIFNLEPGNYEAIVGHTDGSSGLYGTKSFTVINEDIDVTLYSDENFDENTDADYIYNRTTYFDHVDVRVKGKLTQSGTLHTITLSDVHLYIDKLRNGSSYSKTFNTNTNYEWRATGLSIPKDATITITFDINIDNQVAKDNYSISFSGKSDFVQAIINCDHKQGLDFIINASSILEAAVYSVDYVWEGLDSSLSNITPPAKTSDYAPGDEHVLDTEWKENETIVDTTTGYVYTFSGWEYYIEENDSTNTKNNTSATIEINDNITIYGKWTKSDAPLPKAKGYITLKKSFFAKYDHLPTTLYFEFIDNSGIENNIAIPYSELDSNGEYNLEIFKDGTYTISEYNYDMNGYEFNGVTINHIDNENYFSNVSTKNQSITFTVTLPHDYTGNTILDLGEIEFLNSYTKKTGNNIKYLPEIHVLKESQDREVLEGAEFTLEGTTKDNQPVLKTQTTDDAGYTIFTDLEEGNYVIYESKAPKGYHNNPNVKYILKVDELKCSSEEIYDPHQQAYVFACDYGLTISPEQNYNANNNRITFFNEKIYGSITITKEFGINSEIDKNNLPVDMAFEVKIYNNTYSKTIILNEENNYTLTIDGLELGTYNIKELTDSSKIRGYDLSVEYSSETITLTDTNYEVDATVTNTYTENDEITYIDVTVNKKWVTLKNTSTPSVEIGLYKDGDLFDTIILDENNNWSYTWTKLDDIHEWEVKELTKLKDYYSKTIVKNNVYTITNYHYDIPDTSDNSSLFIYFCLTLSSLIGLGFIGIFRNKIFN